MNPQAVNEVNFDVFTANKRSVLFLKLEGSGRLVAFVAIGALLVGSIEWTRKVGDNVRKGEELGFVEIIQFWDNDVIKYFLRFFKYGGSTVVTVFEPGLAT